jgi:hypothetical protein
MQPSTLLLSFIFLFGSFSAKADHVSDSTDVDWFVSNWQWVISQSHPDDIDNGQLYTFYSPQVDFYGSTLHGDSLCRALLTIPSLKETILSTHPTRLSLSPHPIHSGK